MTEPLALSDICMVTTTVATEAEAARRLAQAVLQARLAACRWSRSPRISAGRARGRRPRAPAPGPAHVARAVPALLALLRAQHPYTLPQLVVQPLQASAEYAGWVEAEVAC